MVAVLFAKLVGDALGLSVYDTHIKIKGCPVLVRMVFERRCRASMSSAACTTSECGLVHPMLLRVTYCWSRTDDGGAEKGKTVFPNGFAL